MIIHDDYGDKEVEAGDDCHLLASNPFLTQQGHCQAKLETNIWIFEKIDKCRTKFERKSIENDSD